MHAIGRKHGMLVLLICFSVMLLAGSFYPWHYRPGPPLSAALERLWSSLRAPPGLSGLRDIIVNLSIYIPIGFTGYLWPGWGRGAVRVLAPLLFGAGISHTAELLQRYFPPRMPSLLDFVLNTVSAAIGIALAAAFERVLAARWLVWRRRHALHMSSALFLLLLWASGQIWPDRLFPVGILSRLRMLLLRRDWHWDAAAVAAAMQWVVLAALLMRLTGPGRRSWLWFPLAFFLLANMTAPGHRVTFPLIFCALGGVLLFTLLPERAWTAYPGLAAIWLVWIVADGLRPYRLLPAPLPPTWIPFADMLNAPWMASCGVLLRKTWIYGGAFWLLAQTRLRHAWGMVVLLVVVGSVEVAQCWLPGRSPSATDLAAALLGAALVIFVDHRFHADEWAPRTA
jgi:VanZ family protein